MHSFFQGQLLIANRGARALGEQTQSFYKLKTELLKRFAVLDGWDHQLVVKICWNCNGTGEEPYELDYINDEPVTCNRCYGDGEYKRVEWCLLRYRLGQAIFHCPVPISEAPAGSPRTQVGYLRSDQSSVRPEEATAAYLCLLLRYRPKMLLEMFLKEVRLRLASVIDRIVSQFRRSKPQPLMIEEYDDIPF